MSEKRLIVRDDDYAWVDTVTDTVIEVEDAFDLVNELHEENEYLKNRLKSVLNELYCKDRVLEENGVGIECCDMND